MGNNTIETLKLLDQSAELNSEIYSLPGMEESRKELESTLLSDKYKYSPQIPVIRDGLKEAFGKNIQYIRVVNRLMLYIEKFIDSYFDLSTFKGDKNSQEYQDLKTKYEMRSDDIDEYFIHYGQEFADKLREQNPKLDRREQMKFKLDLFNKFKDLLLQRIQYIPNKE